MSDWFEGSAAGSVDVCSLLDSEAMKRLAGMVQLGALVSLSLTSDGGAMGVTVTVDGRWRREYFREAEKLDEWTEEAMAPVSAACERRLASAVGGSRQRGPRGR